MKNGVKADDVKAVLGAVETGARTSSKPPPPPPPPTEAKGTVKSAAKDKVDHHRRRQGGFLTINADKVTIDGKDDA